MKRADSDVKGDSNLMGTDSDVKGGNSNVIGADIDVKERTVIRWGLSLI